MANWQECSELWICLNCRTVGPLTEHGRCATCDSDSVAVADRGRPFARSDARRLESEVQVAAVAAAPGAVAHAPAPRMLTFGIRERRAGGHRRTSRYR